MIKIKIDKYCVFLRNYLDSNYDKFFDKDFSETKQELQSDDLYKGSFNKYVDKMRWVCGPKNVHVQRKKRAAKKCPRRGR